MKNPNLKLIGTQQKMVNVKSTLKSFEATVFEIDLDLFLKSESVDKADVIITDMGVEEYFDTF